MIRYIFKLRKNGYSLRKISQELFSQKITSPRGKARWGPETLNKILRNAKYYGSVLLQKTYVPDCMTGRQVTNDGQLPQYLIENNHEAIIKK